MERQRGLDRRSFVKAAVAIGGSAALSACLDREGQVDVAQGPEDTAGLPDRQHAWNEALPSDEHGNDLAPRHNVLLFADYEGEGADGDGTPTDDDRAQIEEAFRSLERAYARRADDGDATDSGDGGSGSDGGGEVGLLFTVGYSPRYFDRFEASLPESVDLPEPEALAPFEDPAADTPDAIVHLASDVGQVVLAAEEALRGNRDELNGVDVEASFDGVLGVSERRTGFVGDGLPAENDDDLVGVPEDAVDEDAPLFMGFKSDFADSQASEDRVTIAEGPFAGGTTQHVSKIRLQLDQWYDQDSRYHREATMFCPVHAEEGLIEGTGANLGDSSGIDENDCAEAVEDHAREFGKVGHSQKAAAVREDGAPRILRRDFDATDDDRATLHFVALQETVADFVETREAMNGTDVAGTGGVGQRTNNGILQYMRVERRGNYLLPPRAHRALPQINPD